MVRRWWLGLAACVARWYGGGGSVWADSLSLDLSKNAIFQDPSKKIRLDERFRMVPASCHFEVVAKSYSKITKM